MFHIFLLFLCFLSCYTLSATKVETTGSSIATDQDNPFQKNERTSAKYLNSLPPLVKKGILECRRLILSENATKEEFMAKFENDLKNDRSSEETKKLFLKWLSASMDCSIWLRRKLKKNSPVVQEFIRIITTQLQDERYLELSPVDKQIKTMAAIRHLYPTEQENLQSSELLKQEKERRSKLRLDELRSEYEVAYRRQQTV